MSRANENLQQAGETVHCDSTSKVDCLNTLMFIISTSTSTASTSLIDASPLAKLLQSSLLNNR